MDINEMHSKTISDLTEQVKMLTKEKDEAVDNWLRTCDERDKYKSIARKLVATLEVREGMAGIKEELR